MHKILESKTIPESAGCYLFKDEKDKIILTPYKFQR
jgi:excinuclease UvrABC nuclease subunit